MSEKRKIVVTIDAAYDDFVHWDGKSEIALIPKIDLDEIIARVTELEAALARLTIERDAAFETIFNNGVTIAKRNLDLARLTHVLEVVADSDGHHDHSLTHSQLIEYAKEALDKGTG